MRVVVTRGGGWGGRWVKKGIVTRLGASKQRRSQPWQIHVLRDSQEHGRRPARASDWWWCIKLSTAMYNFFGENKRGENGVARKHPAPVADRDDGRIEAQRDECEHVPLTCAAVELICLIWTPPTTHPATDFTREGRGSCPRRRTRRGPPGTRALPVNAKNMRPIWRMIVSAQKKSRWMVWFLDREEMSDFRHSISGRREQMLICQLRASAVSTMTCLNSPVPL